MSTAIRIAEAAWGLLTVNTALPLFFSRHRRRSSLSHLRPACAVLVPAWNEERSIAATLASIERQLGAHDRLVVIADNCTDGTAAAARRSARAQVLERNEPALRGKAHALRFAFEFLGAMPPPVVIVIDADSTLHEGALDALVRAVTTSGRPQQAAYRLNVDRETPAADVLSAVAFSWMNEARPRGKAVLGLPCTLNGNGMAFAAKHLPTLNGAKASMVEDRQWTLALALAGQAPHFCAEASVAAPARHSWVAQHQRWERGALRLMLYAAPGFLLRALWRRDVDSLALALDFLTPPASLLALGGVALFLVDRNRFVPLFGVFWISALLFSARSDIGWARAWRGVPAWLLGKLRIYASLPSGAGRDWTREERPRREARR